MLDVAILRKFGLRGKGKRIVLVVLLALFMTGCANEFINQSDDVVNQSFRFNRHDISVHYSILVDSETDVCYLQHIGTDGSGITVLLNADGTPKLWETITDAAE